MTNTHLLIMVLVAGACTFATRLFPFALFGGKKQVPKFVQYLGRGAYRRGASVAQKRPPEHRCGHHRLYAPDPLCVCVTKTKNTKMTAPGMVRSFFCSQ